MGRKKKPTKKPQRGPSVDSVLTAIVDGKNNLDASQAGNLLGKSQQALYELVRKKSLHPVRVGIALVFARSEVERYRELALEREAVKYFQEGTHPLDAYQRLDGRATLKVVDRIFRDWAKLTGVWMIEAPRGSYQRWLERFELVRVSPRSLRRFVEAMLADPELSERARSYFRDQRVFNGPGDNAAERRTRRGLSASALELERAG